MLKGKTVVVGITGSIAAYKMADLCHTLKKMGADVHVIMTKNATEFISPLTFETLTNNKCITDTFDRNFMYNVEHVSLAKKADIFVVAPASANIISKIANGICDDMLTTTICAFRGKKLIAPAMNTNMYLNPIIEENILKLKKFDYEIIEPVEGLLACDDIGKGKLAPIDLILERILFHIQYEKDLEGKKILVTAGPTKEAIDPIRFITNHSSGKMGYAIANNAYKRGASVTLLTGASAVNAYKGINVINTTDAKSMFNAVKENYKNSDVVIMCAAVADYTTEEYSENKIKKSDSDMILHLKRTDDILKYLGENKTSQKIIGFSMETENMIPNSQKKLINKKCDMICANSLSSNKTGFGVDTNQITFITKDNVETSALLSKDALSNIILDKIKEL